MGEETELSESMSSEDVKAAGEVAADEPHKKVEHRKRKKTLYKALREQMEFYLGDANLTKERFLHDLIQGQPFVYMELSVFLACNKIKLLTSSIEDLAKALKHSELLQLSPDGTKVCRTTPIVAKENVDECTIYVEQLGPDVDHSSLSKMFSSYGQVDYVSIPKFSNTNKTKGFAFVEFKDPETAQTVLEDFKARGRCLSPQMAPNELQSIKNFNSENRDVPSKKNEGRVVNNMQQQQLEKIEVSKDKQENEETDKNNSAKKAQKTGKKRKRSDDNDALIKKLKDESKCKLTDTDQEVEADDDKSKCKEKENELIETTVKNTGGGDKKLQEENADTNTKRKSKKRKHSTGSENADNSSKVEDNPAEPERKKAKSETEDGTENETSQTEDGEDADETVKQKKKRKRKKRNKKDKPAVTALLGLKVLSKKEWKQLRNKYLNMQRETMHCLKQHLQYSRREKTRNLGQASKTARNLAPGTVIKVTLQEPVNNINSVKSDMRINPDIRYVDATEGSPVVYLRTSTAELASSLVQTKNWPNMEVIKGDEEKEYWDKIEVDRKNQFYSKKKQKKQNERGRNKLLKRAERFQGQHMTTLEASPNQS